MKVNIKEKNQKGMVIKKFISCKFEV